jgi:hypothetical protein
MTRYTEVVLLNPEDARTLAEEAIAKGRLTSGELRSLAYAFVELADMAWQIPMEHPDGVLCKICLGSLREWGPCD